MKNSILNWAENLTLDYNSEMIVKENGYLEVMADATEDLTKKVKDFMGGEIQYLDFYVTIDPQTNLAEQIEIIARYEEDVVKTLVIILTSVPEKINIFLTFESQDNGFFKESLEEAKEFISNAKLGLSDEEARNKWWDAYYNYASDIMSDFSIDETDFVAEAIERGIDSAWVTTMTTSADIGNWFHKIANEHGLM